MATENTTRTAPYVAFKSFCSAVQSLRSHGLPPTLNRTAWESRSGAEQSQILGALKFLGLTDDKGATQDSLKQLVALTENSDEERQFYASLLRTSYDTVFKLDLQTETPKQLEDAIGQYGVSGKVKDRAVRFFLKAALFARIPLSSRLTADMRDLSSSEPDAAETPVAPKTNGKTRKKRAPRIGVPPVTSNTPDRSAGTSKTVRLKSGGTLTLSHTLELFSLNTEDRKFVFDLIDKLDGYAQPAEESGQNDLPLQ